MVLYPSNPTQATAGCENMSFLVLSDVGYHDCPLRLETTGALNAVPIQTTGQCPILGPPITWWEKVTAGLEGQMPMSLHHVPAPCPCTSSSLHALNSPAPGSSGRGTCSETRVVSLVCDDNISIPPSLNRLSPSLLGRGQMLHGLQQVRGDVGVQILACRRSM